MEISPLNSTNEQGIAAASAQTSDLGRDAFLQLFVTQLRNQDPLEPQGNEQFLAQLAQFSSLELLENLGAEFSTLNGFQQISQASSLLGKEVSYNNPLTGTTGSGRVQSVRLESGIPLLNLGDGEIPYSSVLEIREPTPESN